MNNILKKSMSVKKGDTIAVWFSCGAASAIATKLVVNFYSQYANIRVINNPVKEEHPDNRRFLKDIQDWLSIKIESATNDKFPDISAESVWEKRRYMSGNLGAPCTVELKKRARQNWEQNNESDWIVLGFTAEEITRHKRFTQTERLNLLPELIRNGITKQDCFNILRKNKIDLPDMYKLGYPNSNCIGCVKASSTTYWNHVRKCHPKVFEARSIQSKRLGAKLVRVKGTRIYLDELKPTDKGNKMNTLNIECGSFCEELEH